MKSSVPAAPRAPMKFPPSRFHGVGASGGATGCGRSSESMPDRGLIIPAGRRSIVRESGGGCDAMACPMASGGGFIRRRTAAKSTAGDSKRVRRSIAMRPDSPEIGFHRGRKATASLSGANTCCVRVLGSVCNRGSRRKRNPATAREQGARKCLYSHRHGRCCGAR